MKCPQKKLPKSSVRKAKAHLGEVTRPLFKALGSLALVLGLAATSFGLYDRFTRPELAISLALRSGGFELGLRNGGRSIAEDVSVEIIGWRQGPPAPEINERHDAKSLIPGEEYTVYPVMKLDAWLQPETFSGHIVATCRRCSEPKAWAFNFGLPVWERNRETAFGQVRMADS